jgi:hypothetical protein
LLYQSALELRNFNEDDKITRRWRHCSCYVKETNKIIVFGGNINTSESTNDTLCFAPNGQLISSQVFSFLNKMI